MAYSLPVGEALQQSDILANVRTFELSGFNGNVPMGIVHDFGYAVVVTQACDLEQDFKARFPPSSGSTVSQDKLLFSIMLCGAYRADAVKAGLHRQGAVKISSKIWSVIERNGEPRYQYLGHVPMLGESLIADFKDYFFVSCDYLYDQIRARPRHTRRVASMEAPYREQVLQRFTNYIGRVGLPHDFGRLPTAFPTAWGDPIL